MEKIRVVFSTMNAKKWTKTLVSVAAAVVVLAGAGFYLTEEVVEVQPATIVGRAGDVPIAVKGLKGQFGIYKLNRGPYSRVINPPPVRSYNSPLRGVAFYRETPKEGLPPPPASLKDMESKEWQQTHRLVTIGFNLNREEFLGRELKNGFRPQNEAMSRIFTPYLKVEGPKSLPGWETYSRTWKQWPVEDGKVEGLLFVDRNEAGALRTIIECAEVKPSKLDDALCLIMFGIKSKSGWVGIVEINGDELESRQKIVAEIEEVVRKWPVDIAVVPERKSRQD